jgi:dihydropyrimidinase
MAFDLVVKDGTIHSPRRSWRGDIAVRGGRIAALGEPGTIANARRVVDATGMDVIPGCIDVHVHLALPFCGTVSCDDFESGSRAAASGCVTTVIDFAIPGPGETLADADRAWRAKAEGKSMVDYAWHLALTRREHLAEIPSMVARGLPTFKAFMIYESEGWNADDAMLYAALEACRAQGAGGSGSRSGAAGTAGVGNGGGGGGGGEGGKGGGGGAMLLVHAESPRVLDLLIARRHTPDEMRRLGAKLHTITRPHFVEAEAIERAIHWSQVTGGSLYIVHLSTGQGADLVKAARARGVPVLAETCAQYLVLDDRVFDRPDGHLYACCPQVKTPADIARLWEAIGPRGGELSVVSTDTCSFTREQKGMWWEEAGGYGDWTKIPMGLPGLDTLVPLMYTLGVGGGRISMNRLVELCAANPAKIMGLSHRKGEIAPGMDADIAIIDPRARRRVVPRGRAEAATLESNCDWSPYEGMDLGGFAHTALVRGEVVVEGHRVVGRAGHGEFLERRGVGRV